MLPALGERLESTGCWVNGSPGEQVPASNRGLHYGDGLFEVMAVKDGRVLLAGFHLDRLFEGAERLHIALPSRAALQQELVNTARDQQRAVLKLVVTRGGRAEAYRPLDSSIASRVLMRFVWPNYPAAWAERGVHLRICDTHFGHNVRLAGLKHLNRLEQVLAQSEWSAADDLQEGLMTDAEGSVISGSASNVFAWLSHGVLATPSLRLCGVAGVMRRYLLEKARSAGLPLRIATLSLTELMKAQEIFLTNVLIGVWPVVRIGHWKYAVGPVTRQMQAWAMQCESRERSHA